ncbi:MAG: hypothetical protein FWE13_03900 [Firmicutes bacterium]|nr:hypothetical protein [Bacillota bacterium]
MINNKTKRIKKITTLFVAIIMSAFTLALLTGCPDEDLNNIHMPSNRHLTQAQRDLFLFNPYRNVDIASTPRFKADLHQHTTNSDGLASPNEMARRNATLGMDFVAFADHDHTWYGQWAQHPAGHIVITAPGATGLNRVAQAQTWPWSAFGVQADNHGLIPIQATELSRMHHIGSFFTDFTDHTNNQSARTDRELLEQATAHGQGVERFEIFHPQRYLAEVTGTTEFDAHLEWLNRPDQIERLTAGWYQNLIRDFPNIISMEMFNQDNRHPSIHIYDRIMRGMFPSRPIWMSANSDDHTGHGGFSVNVMLLPERTIEAFQHGWETGAYFAKSFGDFDPNLLEIPEQYWETELEMLPHLRTRQNWGARWSFLPRVNDIIICDALGYIRVDASNFTHFEWITEDGVVVADGNIVNFRTNTAISNYVRGQLTRRDETGRVLATTLMQPFGVGTYDPTSGFFRFAP